MNINSYIDSTYLKTPAEAKISIEEDLKTVRKFIEEAINEEFKLIMIRPNHVAIAKKIVVDSMSNLKIGTVIDFPNGDSSIEKKLTEAQKAINDGADDLDFVCNYIAFKNKNFDLFEAEILKGTAFALQHQKTIKWIIEVAALTNDEIIEISKLIKKIVLNNFKSTDYNFIFVKSSTGFYKTENNLPNGATEQSVKLMLENAFPLPVKAAGGIRNLNEALAMIDLGVKRIGTSNAKNMINNIYNPESY